MAINSPKNDFVEKHRFLTYADEVDTVYDGSKILDGSVTTDKIADYAVTTDKIDDESITLSKMNTDVLNLLDGNVKGFDTVADMQAATLEAGDICHTNGFHASGDGGAAFYKISASGTANGMDVLACGDVFANLVITESYVTPEMFGAYGDGTTDDTSVLTYLFAKNIPVETTGIYGVSSTVNIVNDIEMHRDSFIKALTALERVVTIAFASTQSQRCSFRVNVDSNSIAQCGIGIARAKNCILNLSVKNSLNIGVQCGYVQVANNENYFEKIHVTGLSGGDSEIGVLVDCSDNTFGVINCFDVKIGVQVKSGELVADSIHAWLTTDGMTSYWDDSAVLNVEGGFNAKVNWLYQDSIRYGVLSHLGIVSIDYLEENTTLYSGANAPKNVKCYDLNGNADRSRILIGYYKNAASSNIDPSFEGMTAQSIVGWKAFPHTILDSTQITQPITDVDDYTSIAAIGVYYFRYNTANLPVANNSIVECCVHADYLYQRVNALSGAMQTFFRRRKLGDTSWSVWKQFTYVS